MQRSFFPLDDVWTFAGASAATTDREPVRDTLVIDGGDPFPLAAETVTTVTTSAAKPVASIATLADYLVNGFWQYNNAIAHHWSSNTITYNITGLNSAEQFLALSALQAYRGALKLFPQPERKRTFVSRASPTLSKSILSGRRLNSQVPSSTGKRC